MLSLMILKIGLIITLLLPQLCFAHPGNTDSSGCHTCKTNCGKYGLSYGQYHCHRSNGGSGISTTNSDSSSVKAVIVCKAPYILIENDCLMPLNACLKKYGAQATLDEKGECQCKQGYVFNVPKTNCIYLNQAKTRTGLNSRGTKKAELYKKKP